MKFNATPPRPAVRMALACLLFACLAAPAFADDSIRHKLIKAHGADAFDKVEQVNFTFNVKKGKGSTMTRKWTWWPKSGKVRVETGGSTLEFNHATADKSSQSDIRKADAWFINDSFWLLLPVHLRWNTDASYTDYGQQPLPIGEGKARKITIAYPDQGGYTPGDAYDLYVDQDWRIQQWAFRKGGRPQPNLVTTWADYQQFGPLLLSTDRQGPDGKFHLFFTDVAVETE